MGDIKKEKSSVGIRRWVICIGLPILMMALSTAIMYSEKAKFMKDNESSVSETTSKTEVSFTYIIDNVEYTEEQMMSFVTEPCLASRVITYSDGSSSLEDCYITFSSDRTEVYREYRNGVFTIVIPRDVTA